MGAIGVTGETMFSSIKVWGAIALAAFVTGLIAFGKVMKKQRDSARRTARTLKSTVQAQRKTRVAKKKAEKKLFSRVAQIKKQLEKPDEEFKGVGDLADLSKRKRKPRVRK